MKKIKVILSAVLALVCVLSVSLTVNHAYAKIDYDEMDKLFQSTLSGILDYENAEDTTITAEKELLHDIALNPLGLLYRFTYQGTEGFAIIIDDGAMQVTEIAPDSPAPYQENETIKVYVSLGMYWYNDGTDYYDCATGYKIADEAVETVSETAFFGNGVLQYESEKVYYLYRSESKWNDLSSIPNYTFAAENGCAAVAGSNLVAYYDKVYTNLIPNYDPGTLFLGIYSFKGENTTTVSVALTLYDDMKTNVIQPGTTVSQFKDGMKTYVNRHGYSISYTSMMSGSQFNYESAKSIVQNGKAMAIFLSGYRTVNMQKQDGYDNLMYEFSDANHIVAGFGCLEVNYTLSNNTSRTDKYVRAAMGNGFYSNGYFNIATSKVNDAYALNIG